MLCVISTIESEMASRIDREGPEHVEEARQHDIDDAAEEAGDKAEQRRQGQADHGRRAGDQQRVAAAIEQPGHDVAALVVGAEQIGAETPGRPDRRGAEAEALGRGLHHRLRLAVDHDLAVEVGAERIGAGDMRA